MKTAMELAIEKVIDSRIAAAEKKNQNALLLKLRNIKSELSAYLPKEREQLERAWDDGEKEGYTAGYQQCEDGSSNRSSLFNTYFKTTYNEKD